MQRLILDPGHGGKDPGMVGGALVEKKYVYDLAHAVRKHLYAYYMAMEVVIIQPSDYLPDIGGEELDRVVATANLLMGELLLSLHVDAGGGTGWASYVSPGAGVQTIQMRDVLHDTLKPFYAGFGMTDRGKRVANYMILRETEMPAILIETGFGDNEKDRALLMSHIDALGNEIAYALVRAMGLVK